MKDYIGSSNRAFNTYTEDPQAPQTPVVTSTGPAGFPANALTFSVGPFSDPQGNNTFGAMRWRIAEVTIGSQSPPPQGQGVVFISDGAQWKYFKGTTEPSATQGAWRKIDFDDTSWLQGRTAIGYGETFIITPLNDMRKGGSYAGYTTVYLRKTFDAASLAGIDKLVLEVKYECLSCRATVHCGRRQFYRESRLCGI